ncbi:hypothetical protein [Streptomyces chrestomyceticus]|uniref:hypothetical protein n=1 Tax=Streptomyces chrestomyceticus TaxID=68185 RepID=UPI0033EAF582
MATTEDEAAVRDVAGGVRDLLRGTGTFTDNKWRRGLRQGRESNVLFAVGLHAAERRDMGHQLTDLEQSVLDVFGAVLSDAEILAAGREYRAAVRDLGQVPLLPTVVTDTLPDRGFAVSDLMAHLPAMRQANKSRANCAQVDIGAVAAGEPLDSDAFNAAVGEVGFGVTALTGPPPATPAKENPAYNAKFEFESFTCLRPVGDGASGRDEIYFTAAARSDKDTDGGTYRSEEFGGVKEGHTRYFDNNRKVVFDGPAGVFTVVVVQTWEADHSGSEFYDKLMMALEAWLERPVWVEITMAIVTAVSGGLGAVVDAVDSFIQMFVSLKEVLRNLFENADDLSCERGFVFDRNAMVTLYNRGDDWHFNGDGHHKVRVKYTGERPVFPTGALEYTTIAGSTQAWSAPVAMGWESASSPALCSFRDELHCMYVRPGDRALMWSSLTDGAWSKPVQVNGNYKTDYAPALAEFQGKLYMAHVALNGQLLVAGWDGTTWTAYNVPDAHATAAPGLDGRRDKMSVGFRNENGKVIRKYSNNGTAWQGSSVFPPETVGPVSLVAPGRNLWFAYLGPNGKPNVTIDRPDMEDLDLNVPDSWRDQQPGTPVLTYHKYRVWLASRHANGRIRVLNGGDGEPWNEPADAAANAMEGEPALASHNGRLHVMYRR